ncbi:hypothetical protein CHS0354_033327 [Potamilus streckersoni]|uniref:Uncharacterized protein n=1 Tax=Potamilus streckersoni TaxID=2493646 RepID=A0AAE0RTY1_9BIVA|nr:hypothetical protein CHS0354_033327 [Potamilus streckersoni]
MVSPLFMLVSFAVGAGILGSLFLIIAISVDAWESVTFRMDVLSQYTNNSSKKYSVDLATSENDFSKFTENETTFVNGSEQIRMNNYFLFTTYTGIWRTCDILSDDSRYRLETLKGETMKRCYVYVSEYDEEDTNLSDQMKGIGGMQNSAASCVIVSLINLAVAAIVGTISIVQRQVSACMVTGVLYGTAGLFCAFGLTIFHTKMYYEKYQCYSFTVKKLPGPACDARIVEVGWAISFAWAAIVVCIIGFALWIFATRTLRIIISKTML